jgi:hypothetical protein
MKSRIQLACAGLLLIVGAVLVLPSVHAQSVKHGGGDVAVQPVEQWFQRIGLLNPNGGCDVAVEYAALNTWQIDDCSAAKNLVDGQMRGLTLSGVPTTQGAASTDAVMTKTVTGIADATATAVFTVTVPNTANAAIIPIVIGGSLGAGGAIGAFECTATAYGQIVVTRTPGVATVATATTLADTGSACVVGATTETLAYAVSAMTGAVTVAQTFKVNVTITKGGGASANHSAIVQADLLNANAAGITIS